MTDSAKHHAGQGRATLPVVGVRTPCGGVAGDSSVRGVHDCPACGLRHTFSAVPSGDCGDSRCVFCLIVDGADTAIVVRDWSDAIAIRPLNPVTPGHVLVIPKLHVSDLAEVPFVTGAVMARAAELAVPPCNLITSAGREATQTVGHLHVHVVPRRKGDGLELPWGLPRGSYR